MNRTANETLSRLLADFMNTTYGLMTIMSQKNFSDISNTIKPYMYVMNANMIGNQSQFLAMVSSLFGMLQNSYG